MKKNWVINKSEMNTEISPNISWSSSDSDEESKSPKKLKVVTPDSESNPFFEINKSPVISRRLILQESPTILTTDTNSTSPVISNNHRIKKIKKKIYCNVTKNSFTEHFGLLLNEKKTEVLIEDDSSQNSNNHEEITNSYKISQFSNTQKSDFGQSYNYDVELTSSDTQTTNSYNDSPMGKLKRKRRFKKFGLAAQLQKALNNREKSLAIWKHELYLNKEKGNIYDVGVGFKLHVLRKMNDGIYECRSCDEKKYFVITNSVQIKSETKIIIIYKPYECRNIIYKNESYCCCFNVYKVIED